MGGHKSGVAFRNMVNLPSFDTSQINWEGKKMVLVADILIKADGYAHAFAGESIRSWFNFLVINFKRNLGHKIGSACCSVSRVSVAGVENMELSFVKVSQGKGVSFCRLFIVGIALAGLFLYACMLSCNNLYSLNFLFDDSWDLSNYQSLFISVYHFIYQ